MKNNEMKNYMVVAMFKDGYFEKKVIEGVDYDKGSSIGTCFVWDSFDKNKEEHGTPKMLFGEFNKDYPEIKARLSFKENWLCFDGEHIDNWPVCWVTEGMWNNPEAIQAILDTIHIKPFGPKDDPDRTMVLYMGCQNYGLIKK